MVLNRPLLETLEGTAYTAITDTLQTNVSASLPEEVRWLAMYEQMAWPGLPASFRKHFAVVAERLEVAQRWVHAPVVSQLLNAVEGEGGAERARSPMVLMLVRGRVYLRVEHTQRSLAECLRTGAKRFGWDKRKAAPAQAHDGRWLIGMGVAAAFRNNLLMKSAARVKVDKRGIVRFTHIGEGAYAEMERHIQGLLLEP